MSDNRDIFEKALDDKERRQIDEDRRALKKGFKESDLDQLDLATAAGAVAAGIIQGRVAGKMLRGFSGKPSAAAVKKNPYLKSQRELAKRWDNNWTAGGTAVGGITGAQVISERNRTRKKYRK